MKKNRIIILAVAVFSLTVISELILLMKWNNLGYASRTCKKLAKNLYYIELHGNDGFEEMMRRGGPSSSEDVTAWVSKFLSKGPFGKNVNLEIKEIEAACTTFIAPNGKGGFTAARNFDWFDCQAIIVKNNPDFGYKSVCTSNLDFLGFGDGYVPTQGIVNRIKAIAALYVPMDGMNEKGLFVADLMAGDDEVTNQMSDKPDVTTTTAIRLLLNRAASVDEAVKLLGEYDMHSDIGKAHHLFIADASGKSVVVEYVANVMYVKDTPALTNHYLTDEKSGVGSTGSVERMNRVLDSIGEGSTVDFEKGKEIINSVANEYTQWSIIYSLGEQKNIESVFFKRDFSKAFEYSLE